MNLIKIIDQLNLDNIDQEEFLKPAMRSELFKKAKDFSLKVALASVPFAMANMPRVLKAASMDANTDVLNFALTLEYLEDEFYKMGLAAPSLIPNADRTIMSLISKHEDEHVKFLKTALGNAAGAKPKFDFTAKGTFADVFTNYQTFLALSQSFEDTGVRAYKGQAGAISDKGILTAALQIHSVEGRHASMVRRLRGQKGWIVNNDAPGLPAPIYAGEENFTQAGVDLRTIPGVTSAQVTEAFDEPLTKDQVLAIAGLFIVA